MSKKNKQKENKEKLVRSINKNVRSSTRKLKPLLKNIVGKKVDIAIRDLNFSEKRISREIKKTISFCGVCWTFKENLSTCNYNDTCLP